ncbi:hypothetical protein AB205_0024320, partial [Aquarana catesbeiana]
RFVPPQTSSTNRFIGQQNSPVPSPYAPQSPAGYMPYAHPGSYTQHQQMQQASVSSPIVAGGLRNLHENKVSGQLAGNSANHHADNSRHSTSEDYLQMVHRLGSEDSDSSIRNAASFSLRSPQSVCSPAGSDGTPKDKPLKKRKQDSYPLEAGGATGGNRPASQEASVAGNGSRPALMVSIDLLHTGRGDSQANVTQDSDFVKKPEEAKCNDGFVPAVPDDPTGVIKNVPENHPETPKKKSESETENTEKPVKSTPVHSSENTQEEIQGESKPCDIKAEPSESTEEAMICEDGKSEDKPEVCKQNEELVESKAAECVSEDVKAEANHGDIAKESKPCDQEGEGEEEEEEVKQNESCNETIEDEKKKEEKPTPSTPKLRSEGKSDTPKQKTEGKPETPRQKNESKQEQAKQKSESKSEQSKQKSDSRTDGRTDNPKQKTDGRPETPKQKADGRPETPKQKADGRPETPKHKSESRPETPKQKNDGRPETPKQKNDGRPETPKQKSESRQESHKKSDERHVLTRQRSEGRSETPKHKHENRRDSLRLSSDKKSDSSKHKTDSKPDSP